MHLGIPLPAGWLAFMGLFTFLLVPETKGVPIEDIESKFRSHWFWKRVMARADAAAGSAGPSPVPQLEMASEGLEPVCKVVKVGGDMSAVDKATATAGVHRVGL